ncbi:MAG: hypothetical protein JW867_07640 [Candidatus Omnitrophica bacterium]|nr:hypothetical protein [Candidatus Omnitrophota bacterium]
MTEEKKSTPESELLKFIEDKQVQPRIKARATAQKGKSFVSLGGAKGRASFFKASFKNFSIKKIAFNVKILNFLLLIILALLAVLMVYDILSSILGMKGEVAGAFEVDKRPQDFQLFQDLGELENKSHYLEKARKRDIFKIVSKASLVSVDPGSEKGPDIGPKPIVLKMQNLKLVGISWSNDPDAMIEDTQMKKTFFLKRGDLFNELKVEAIFKNKVILSYLGEEAELK